MRNLIRTLVKPSLKVLQGRDACRARIDYSNIKYCILIWMCIAYGAANAQVYKAAKKIDKTRKGYNTVFSYSDGKLFYGSGEKLGYIKNFISYDYPKLELDKGSTQDSMDVADLISVHDTNVFAVGMFEVKTGRYGVVQLKNGHWDTLPMFNKYFCSKVVNFKDTLYILSWDLKTGVRLVLQWDMKNAPKVLHSENFGSIELLATHLDKYLVILGNQKRMIYDGSTMDTAAFDNNYTNIYTNTHDSNRLYFMNYKKQIYTVNSNKQLIYFDTLAAIDHAGSMAEQDGYLYFGISNQGLVARMNVKTRQVETIIGVGMSGNTVDFLSGGNIIYAEKSSYTTNWVVDFYSIVDGALVSGKLFEDVDNNCTLSSGDQVYKRFRGFVASSSDTFPILSDDTGYFHVTLPVGSQVYRYFVSEKYIDNKSITCNIKDSFLVSTSTKRDVPFAVQTGKHDARVDITCALGWRVRQGFTEKFVVQYKNIGTSKEDLEIEVVLPDSFTYDSGSIATKNISDKKLTFELKNIPKFTSGQFNIYIKVHVNIATNMRKKVICKIPLMTGETDSLDNKDTIEVTVRGAYDPNSKHSNPEGKVYSPVKNIDYYVHFQNMGSDTAYRVIVVDTFLPNFPLYKLQMKGSSHAYDLKVEPGNVIVWTFNNILLPPLRENVQASQGFVAFEAPLNAFTKPGTIISNRAHIYFDYQRPVITEWNKIEHSAWGVGVKPVIGMKGDLTIYPNPVSTELTVKIPSNAKHVSIYNISGKLVQQVATNPTEYLTINMSSYPAGLYLIVAGSQQAKVIKN